MSGTPTKQRTKDRKSDGTKQNVKLQIGAKIISDIDIREWIGNVWNIDNDAITVVLDRTWILDQAALQEFQEAMLQPDKVEHHFYGPFTELCVPFWNTLLGDEVLSPSDQSKSWSLHTKLWHREGDFNIYAGDDSKSLRRPDFLALSSQTLLWLDQESKRRPDWSMTVFPMEVQKTCVSKLRKKRHPLAAQPATHVSEVSAELPNEENRRHSMPPIDEEPSHTSSSKRSAKRKMVQDPENGSQQSNKRPRRYQTKKESQLAAYALECFVATPRLYVVGIAQRDSQIILSYFDATCVLRMASFDFVENPQYLALVLFGVLKCTPRDAGFSPFFHPGPAEEGEEGSMARRWKGSTFIFPGEKNSSDLSFYVEDKPWFIAPEVNGRMTCVIPVVDEQGRSLVLKTAYTDGARSLEINLVQKLLNKAPKLKKYLPDITWSRLYDSEKDLHLPRFRFTLDVLFTFPVRHLLYFACKRYEKLWQVQSLEEFKAVFIDYVECHYWAYKEGKVLHRDVSDNNLMVYRDGHTVVGILNDWDV